MKICDNEPKAATSEGGGGNSDMNSSR